MPWCIPCHCPDTVKHILLDCMDLPDTRIKYYRNIDTMKKLFNENGTNDANLKNKKMLANIMEPKYLHTTLEGLDEPMPSACQYLKHL